MIRWRISTILVVNIVVLLPVSAFSSNITCPYDIPFAAGMMPPACYANATATAIASGFSSVTNCCWFVFAAYIYAAIRHANLTGAAFLPPSTAAVCSSSFSSYLITHGLARPSLLLSNSSCNLDGDPVRLAAGSRPCQFPFVSLVRSSADLSQADRLCTSPPLDPDSHLNLCSSCQTAVIKITFALLNATKSKEFVPCGMAATLAIWSPHNPSLPRFRSFALCMLQVLQNIGDLGTGNLIPSPPSFPPPFPSTYSPVHSSTKTTKIVAGSAAAASVSFLGIVAFIGFLIRKRMRKRKLFSTDIAAVEVIPASPALPTEGLYIFTKAELKQATNGYEERLLLGSGGAGKVYLGKLPSGHQVAIKRIYREKKLTEFYREVEVLAKLRHRNLTTLVGYYLGERDEHALVYEYMAGGNLARALAGEVGLPWTRRLHIAAEVAAGLAYLHDFLEGAVVHRDVKPTNILLTEDGKAKLSDFGVSRIVPPEGSHVSTEVRGTLGYVDPESFSVGHVSETADVYSFGVVLLELVTGMKAVVPTPSGGAESIVHAARAAVAATSDVGVIVDRRLGPSWDRPTILSTFELARRCVRPYKEERPAMREVLSELRALVADLESRNHGGIVAALSSAAEGGMSPSPSPMSTTTEEHTWSGSDSCS